MKFWWWEDRFEISFWRIRLSTILIWYLYSPSPSGFVWILYFSIQAKVLRSLIHGQMRLGMTAHLLMSYTRMRSRLLRVGPIHSLSNFKMHCSALLKSYDAQSKSNDISLSIRIYLYIGDEPPLHSIIILQLLLITYLMIID